MSVSSTNVPSPTFGSTGFVAPSESAVLTGVLEDLNTAFGGNLNTTNLSTPQGQLASSIAAIIGNCNDQFLFLTQQFDPRYASAPYQDALAQIYFLTRKPAIATTVNVLCTGLNGTVIPVNAQVADVNGNIYLCTQAGTIPVGGSITLPFACATLGPIACAVGAITTIYKAIPGWDLVSNATQGVIGQAVETQQAFEYRREQSVSINATGNLPSLYANVFNVSGVVDVYCTENFTNSPVTIGDVTLAPHSLWVCVSGGSSAAIAQAIWLHKSLGCNYNGNTTVVVQDTSGYNAPYPTYNVTFNIPTALPIYFSVTIANNSQLPSNFVTLVQNAIVSAFAGGDGGPRARIGSTIFASRFYSPVIAISASGSTVAYPIEIYSLYVATTASPTSGNSVVVGIDYIPTIAAGNISVTLM